MAQQLQSINLVAPAFKGINTEDSPLAQDPSFADVADNAVIDKRGRIASRKGNLVITTNKTELGSAKIRAIKEFEDNAGNTKVFSVGNNKILSGTTTLVDHLPVVRSNRNCSRSLINQCCSTAKYLVVTYRKHLGVACVILKLFNRPNLCRA